MRAAGTAEALAACTALYTSPDPAQRGAANAWLMQFAATDAAWASAFELLASPTTEVKFWAANMLHAKVQKDWSPSMAEATQSTVYAKLLELTLGASSATLEQLSLLVVERLCLCVATIATSRSPAAVVELLQRCLSVGAKRPLVALAVLEALPAAVRSSHFTAAEQERLGASLTAAAASVARFLEFALSDDAAPLAQRRLVLRTLTAWAGTESNGGAPAIPLSALADHHELLRRTLHALADGASSDVTQLAADAVCTLVARAGDADEALLGAIASAVVAMYGACSERPESPAWLALALAVGALCESHAHIVARGAEPYQSLLHVLLRCTAHAERSVGAATFEAWLALQDVPVEERHPALQRDAWVSVIYVPLRVTRILLTI